MKKVLVIGYGAMGMYLVPELSQMGYQVDVVCLENVTDQFPNVTFTQADCSDDDYLTKLVTEGKYDGVVDFLIYTVDRFKRLHAMFLENTGHYIHPSSYRIYSSEELPIRETSPRLLDITQDSEYLAMLETEYSLYKAAKEDILLASPKKNWTILRPAITYSKFRFQLVILEANTLIHRIRNGQTVVLPENAMDIQATMTWAGDVAKMIARLVGNPKAMGEIFSVTTAEHHTWREIAEYYQEIAGLDYVTCDRETFLGFFGGSRHAGYQLDYDRCLNRIMDNSKILEVTGMKQEELMPLKEGLAREYNNLPQGFRFEPRLDTNRAMDEYLKHHEA